MPIFLDASIKSNCELENNGHVGGIVVPETVQRIVKATKTSLKTPICYRCQERFADKHRVSEITDEQMAEALRKSKAALKDFYDGLEKDEKYEISAYKISWWFFIGIIKPITFVFSVIRGVFKC